ncbi:MAG: hypothetical protein ABIQ12_04465 [Opitutaceae bacterium]
MYFSHKSKGFFVELSDHGVMIARTSGPTAPFVLEDMLECAPNDLGALKDMLVRLQPKKTPSGYLHAAVGIYPEKRLVRRQTVEPKRVKDHAYLAELCAQQFRIEEDKYSLAILNANDGIDFDSARGTQKDVVFCGLPIADAQGIQASLLESGIYPERLELGSVATLGGVVDCLAFSRTKGSVLVLEIGMHATHSFIVSANGVEASRSVAQGLEAMVPIVQKELGLKDEESARKLFYSNTFDFTGMGPLLIKKVLKELQSAIGFYEVQTGQSVAHVFTTQLSPKLSWLDAAVSGALGISSLKLDPVAWLESRQVSVPEALLKQAHDNRWFGLLSLIAQTHSAHAVAA